MSSCSTVVAQSAQIAKPRLHALLMSGWSRGIAAHGKGGFADKLEISAPALDKQLTCSMPGFDVIDRALDTAAESALDFATSVTRARSPHSPGGVAIVPQEAAVIHPKRQKAVADMRRAA